MTPQADAKMLERAARIWCRPECAHIEMDATLAAAFAAEFSAVAEEARREEREACARLVEDGCPRTAEWSKRTLWLDRAAAAIRARGEKGAE